jgi:hypothetical protein
MRFVAKVSVELADGEKLKRSILVESAVSYGDCEYQVQKFIDEEYPGNSYLINEIKKVSYSEILDKHPNDETEGHWYEISVDGGGNSLVFGMDVAHSISRFKENAPSTVDWDIKSAKKTAINSIIWANMFSEGEEEGPELFTGMASTVL